MSFGCGVLRWTPDAFWSATLCELEGAAYAFAPPHGQPMHRAGLVGLMSSFPDEPTVSDLHGV